MYTTSTCIPVHPPVTDNCPSWASGREINPMISLYVSYVACIDTCIMAKIDALSVMDLLWPWKFSQKSKSYRFDKHLYSIILVFLLIWLQSSHWISRHSTYNQYFVCLEFAVCDLMKWDQCHTISSFSCLKYINVNSVTIHQLVLGVGHRQSPFCLNFEVLVPMWPWKICQCHTTSMSS